MLWQSLTFPFPGIAHPSLAFFSAPYPQHSLSFQYLSTPKSAVAFLNILQHSLMYFSNLKCSLEYSGIKEFRFKELMKLYCSIIETFQKPFLPLWLKPFNPILHGGQINSRDAPENTPNKLIFHDFVPFNILQDPLRLS